MISEATAPQLRQMLEGVFAPGGTASEVAIPGYTLAGKTGTANKIDPRTGRVLEDALRRLVRRLRAGAHPKLLVGVMVDEPQGEIYGGDGRGAGVRQDHASFALPYLRIPPEIDSG